MPTAMSRVSALLPVVLYIECFFDTLYEFERVIVDSEHSSLGERFSRSC